jgi:hypothetical protein
MRRITRKYGWIATIVALSLFGPTVSMAQKAEKKRRETRLQQTRRLGDGRYVPVTNDEFYGYPEWSDTTKGYETRTAEQLNAVGKWGWNDYGPYDVRLVQIKKGARFKVDAASGEIFYIIGCEDPSGNPKNNRFKQEDEEQPAETIARQQFDYTQIQSIVDNSVKNIKFPTVEPAKPPCIPGEKMNIVINRTDRKGFKSADELTKAGPQVAAQVRGYGQMVQLPPLPEIVSQLIAAMDECTQRIAFIRVAEYVKHRGWGWKEWLLVAGVFVAGILVGHFFFCDDGRKIEVKGGIGGRFGSDSFSAGGWSMN